MPLKILAIATLQLLVCLIFGGCAVAGTLTGKIRVDDEFKLYLSADDNVQGNLLLSGNSYNTVFDLSTPLVDGQTYYLHVYGKDKGGIAGLLAEFNLAGGYHSFDNNSSQVFSNTTDWRVNNSGWGAYVNASDSNGTNGTSSPGIAEEATWIWSSDPNNDKEVYFSLKITGYASPIPGELTGKIRVDDKFSVYLSESDTEQGDLIASGASWNNTFSLATQLTDGKNYFLHVFAQDVGGIGALIGEFNLTGSDHVFSNEQHHLVSNSTDWQVSKTGWLDYVNATQVSGPSGSNPQISNTADWIWTADANDNQAYFTVAIISQSNKSTLTGLLSIDNEFELYLSHDDNSQGTLIATGNDWQVTDSFTTELFGEEDYYLHIHARDIGGVAAFLGEFSLSGGERVFANNKTSILSGTNKWRVSKTGWDNYSYVVGYGNNGVAPWGPHPQIASNATWIWSDDAYYDDDVYFSLKILRRPLTTEDRSLSARVSVDNEFVAYISTDDNVQGTPISSGNNWPTTYSFDTTLNGVQNYYLHIYARDVGGIAGFLGQFNLSGNELVFSNTQANILTNEVDWSVSTSGWADYEPVTVVNGNNGVQPWGTRPDIAANATWIWSADPENDNEAYFSVRISPPNSVNHFRIEHDAQGLTCEAETVVVKACVDATCAQLYDKPTSINLTPGDWSGGTPLNFTGSLTTTLRITTAGTYTFNKTTASENATLRCFVGSSETCGIEFVDAGFEFIGATVNDKTLPDQIAETSFTNAQLRAVQNNNGVCKAALTGTKPITFGYNCDSPSTCKKSLAGISINNASGENSGTINLTFDNNGIAPLNNLNYADAGRLLLSAQATLNNAQIIKGQATLDVYPDYLQLQVSPASLISTGPADVGKFTAGKNFEWQIGAYGKAGHLLPNYQPGDIKLRVLRLSPTALGSHDGQFNFAPNAIINSSTVATDYTDISLPNFTNGFYNYNGAYYAETGQISLDVHDANYLGNKICTVSVSTTVCDPTTITGLKLDRFIPAYYFVEQANQPALQNVINNVNVADSFTYVGQTNEFSINPRLKIIAKNARDQTTLNYDSGLVSAVGAAQGDWALEPSLDDVNDYIDYIDSSDYASIGSAQVFKGNTPVLDGEGDFDGNVFIEITDATVTYKKVDANYTMYGPVKPFDASVDIIFTLPFLTDANGICYRKLNSDANCRDFSFSKGNGNAVQGANFRFGRFAFKSTYGPEDEALIPEFTVEYYDQNQWLVNTLDNETPINFSQANNQLLLSKKGAGNDLTGSFDPVTSDGKLLLGMPDDKNDFKFSAPGQPGEVYLRLNPGADPNAWPQYLNYDWSGDGKICNQAGLCVNGNGLDYPQAVLSFGLFRGNDRVIQWREVFN